MVGDGSFGYSPGLEGVVAARTRLSEVDGGAGRLVVAGFPVGEIAPRASFEEMLFLLWNDRLPDGQELGLFRRDLAARRELPGVTVEVLRQAARERVPVIDALRMAVATLSLGGGQPGAGTRNEAATLVARLPAAVASYWRLLHGESPVAPDPGLGHAADYLRMLGGKEPSEGRVRALETYLNTVCDHGMNASTFTARVIMSTRSDVVSAVTGAIGALKGPLHGGAPGPALQMVFEIGELERAEAYLRAKLEAGERLMGFGHRVYKVRDPRADVLAEAARRLFASEGDERLYALATRVEATALRLLEAYKPGRGLRTNVEFYTALVLHGVGLEADLFTPTFAVGRSIGWTAHCLEQEAEGRLIRPLSAYVGPRDRAWVPLALRERPV